MTKNFVLICCGMLVLLLTTVLILLKLNQRNVPINDNSIQIESPNIQNQPQENWLVVENQDNFRVPTTVLDEQPTRINREILSVTTTALNTLIQADEVVLQVQTPLQASLPIIIGPPYSSISIATKSPNSTLYTSIKASELGERVKHGDKVKLEIVTDYPTEYLQAKYQCSQITPICEQTAARLKASVEHAQQADLLQSLKNGNVDKVLYPETITVYE